MFFQKKKKKKKAELTENWVDRVSGTTTIFFLGLIFTVMSQLRKDMGWDL